MDWRYDPSLVLYLPLYEPDSTSFMSRDRYGHLATVTGAVWTPLGRSFDGVDDKISIPDQTYLTPVNDYTIIVWFKANSWAGNWYENSIISQPAGGGAEPKWFFTYDGANTIFEWFNGIARTTLSDAWTANIGQWYQIALTKSGTSYAFYKDGISNGTATHATAVAAAAGAVLIGQGQGASDSFNGIIGEVSFYDLRVLTPAEIQRNYLATKWRYQ